MKVSLNPALSAWGWRAAAWRWAWATPAAYLKVVVGVRASLARSPSSLPAVSPASSLQGGALCGCCKVPRAFPGWAAVLVAAWVLQRALRVWGARESRLLTCVLAAVLWSSLITI